MGFELKGRAMELRTIDREPLQRASNWALVVVGTLVFNAVSTLRLFDTFEPRAIISAIGVLAFTLAEALAFANVAMAFRARARQDDVPIGLRALRMAWRLRLLSGPALALLLGIT